MLAELDRPLSRPIRFGATIIIMLSFSIEQSLGYSSGAPTSACGGMTPSHAASPQSTATSPYAVYVSSGQYSPGGQLTVIINGTQPFRGFLLIARTSSSSSSVGSFAATPFSQQVCGGGLTHTSSTPTNSLAVQWTAPASSQGSVQFYATVVQSRPVFWVALSSSIVSESRSSSSTASTTVTSTVRTTAVATTTTTVAATNTVAATTTVAATNAVTSSTLIPSSTSASNITPLTIAQAGCTDTNSSASCFFTPSNCTGSDCNYLLVWRPLPASTSASGGGGSSGLLQFQLQGRKTATPGYVSIGFGPSKSMIGLSVINCVDTNSGATVTQTYSSQTAEPSFLSVASNLQNVTAASSTEFVQCSFVWNNNARTSAEQLDLTAANFLIMARGPAVGNAAGNIRRHAETPISFYARAIIASALNYPLRLSTFPTDEPNKSTESRSTASSTRDMESRFNATTSAGSTLSRHIAMTWLLGMLPCVIALAV